MMNYSVIVRGRQSEWQIDVPDRMVDGLRDDGFEVVEVHNTVPGWAVDAGFAGVWCVAQDAFDLPSKIWRKLRGKP